MKIYYQLLGGHYHCRCFFHGKAGDLVIGESEWFEFRSMFRPHVIFIQEQGTDPRHT